MLRQASVAAAWRRANSSLCASSTRFGEDIRCAPTTRSASRRFWAIGCKLSEPPQANTSTVTVHGTARGRQGPNLDHRVLIATSWGLLALTLVATQAPRFWWADLAPHFRVHYLVLGASVLLLAALVRNRHAIVLAAIVVAWNASQVWALSGSFRSIDPLTAAPGASEFRVVAANVFFANKDYPRMRDWVRAEQADLAVFVEVTPDWQAQLAQLDEYSESYYDTRQGTRGTLILSKWPMAPARALDSRTDRAATTRMTVQLPGAALQLIGVHASWPVTARRWQDRNREFAALAKATARSDAAWILIGDFNSTLFSPHLAAMLERGRLHSAAGRGWRPTWPSWLGVAGIPIDHAFVSERVFVQQLRVGPRLGSDHRPIVLDALVFPEG